MSHRHQIDPRAGVQKATDFLRPLFEARNESKRGPSTITLIHVNEARRQARAGQTGPAVGHGLRWARFLHRGTAGRVPPAGRGAQGVEAWDCRGTSGCRYYACYGEGCGRSGMVC